jgi:mRNA-degrading endonuclease toxin of MazEF toxin-antitoxin module
VRETEQLVKTFPLKASVPYLLWNDLLNKHTLNGSEYDTYAMKNAGGTPIRYARGRKVLVDFGYGVDRELFQPHPAIVLADFQELITVVPTTSDDGSVFHEDVKKAIIKVPSDATGAPGDRPIFPKDTIINLHQIKVVSKNRVQKDLRCNVNTYVVPNRVIDELNLHYPYPVLQHGDHLLRTIEMQLSHLYAPDTLHEVKRLHDQIVALTTQIESLKQLSKS